MSTPAPGIERLPAGASEPSLERTRTVAELTRLSVALNQIGYAFELDAARMRIGDSATSGKHALSRTVTVELLPIDTAGDTSLQLIAFALSSPLDTSLAACQNIDQGLRAAAAILALGSLSTDAQFLYLDYTLAVDALTITPTDVIVDVVELLDRLFDTAIEHLHAELQGEIDHAGLGADLLELPAFHRVVVETEVV